MNVRWSTEKDLDARPLGAVMAHDRAIFVTAGTTLKHH
jgi:hypothetical protein